MKNSASISDLFRSSLRSWRTGLIAGIASGLLFLAWAFSSSQQADSIASVSWGSIPNELQPIVPPFLQEIGTTERFLNEAVFVLDGSGRAIEGHAVEQFEPCRAVGQNLAGASLLISCSADTVDAAMELTNAAAQHAAELFNVYFAEIAGILERERELFQQQIEIANSTIDSLQAMQPSADQIIEQRRLLADWERNLAQSHLNLIRFDEGRAGLIRPASVSERASTERTPRSQASILVVALVFGAMMTVFAAFVAGAFNRLGGGPEGG